MADGTGRGVWLPLIDGAEQLGVLYLRTPAISDELLRRLEDVAGLVSELIVSKTQYGDALVLARRQGQMTLAAELRWAMLPPTTFSADRVALACVLEPAYEVAGDAFDYAFNNDILHLAVMDAMGHGLEASRMANLATAAYRTARRRGLDLSHTYRLVDDALRDQFGDEHFVTGQFATLDTISGVLRWVNAGHPPPLLLRGGRATIELRGEPGLPLGLGGEAPPTDGGVTGAERHHPVLHRRHRRGGLTRRRALRGRAPRRPHPAGAGRSPDAVGDRPPPGPGGAGAP